MPIDPEEPNRSFLDARFKVRWAEKQIGDLQRAIDVLVAEYLETGGAGYDAQKRIAFIQNSFVHPVISLLAGDIIFSLRSALDCCWMGLKRSIGKDDKFTLPRGRIDNIKATIKQTSMENAFPGIERFLLETLQAHEGGNDTLWFVGQLDNWNKHNMLLVVAQRTSASHATFRTPEGVTFQFEGESAFTCFAAEGHYAFAAESSGPFKLDDGANITVDIVLHSRKPEDERLLMPFLRAALKDTRKGVENFASLFGERAPYG